MLFVYKYTVTGGILVNKFKHMKKILKQCIHQLDESSSLFVINPEKDFTRKRKHLFGSTLMNVLLLEGGSLKDELYKLFGYDLDTPTVSSFIQARDKIKPDTFHILFNLFNVRTRKPKLYNGYRLLAVDGSTLPITSEIKDKKTTIQKANNSDKPFSAFHLNTSYDILEYTYDDVILQGQAVQDERDALNKMVERYKGDKAIFIADRGYESINSFEKIHLSGNKYLVRVKDIHSTGMLRSFGPFLDDEFDLIVKRTLTTRQTNEIKAHPEIYKFVPQNQRFDYFEDAPFYDFECRVVRFKITEDTYECIVTNLDKDEFSMQDIKELYHLRWEIETSYRELKYDLDLNTLHSKKRNLIEQEIYAKMLLYNLCSRVTNGINISKRKRKYEYQLNYVRAFHIIREHLKKTKVPSYICDVIAIEILPIRRDRQNKRKLKPKAPVSFNYRFD